ncbi:hypothetical protein DPMN_063701 [Dreissena polymorpha]|uniref:Uncharacterized protein n=1 Tax=Dreissena polymorpha TaxID=45954 RepID=A0A9D4HJD7_DREPO|nr:hypothetical protein DPMN_063701 [Dreissena polymorpha]
MGELERLAQNRDAWWKLISGLDVPDGTAGKDEMRWSNSPCCEYDFHAHKDACHGHGLQTVIV